MARISGFYNRVKHATATTGTGTLTLGSASAGFLTASEAGVADGASVSYVIEEGNDFEIGYGVYTSSGTTLTRATVTVSKIGGTAGTSKMNLAGAATVAIVPLAADIDIVSDYAAAERQNTFLNWIYQSKLYAGYRRGVNLFADGFKASDGVNSGSSSNYSVDTTGGKVSPSTSGGSISGATGTAIGDMTSNGGLAAGFDGTTNQAAASASRGAGGTPRGNIGKDWGSGNTKTITAFTAYSPNNVGFDATGGGSATIRLYGSNSAPSAWSGTDYGGTLLYTSSSIPNASSSVLTVTSGITTTTAYRYHWITIVAASGANEVYCAELVFTEAGTPNNMTLISTAQTADASVSTARGLIEFDNAGTPTLNTDLTIEFTCNGGTNWTSATLTSVTTNSQSGRKVADTGEVACTAGTSFAARIKTLNNKSVPIYGHAMQVR